MSFVRLPRKHYPTRHSAAAKAAGRKKVRNKPDWDDTNNDLSVFKASPEEMMRRSEVTKSQNMDLVKADLLRKKIAKAKSRKTSPKSLRGGLLREVLLDNSELQDTLAASDKTMAIVKDLFGDDPKRFRGLPNVTVAPERDALDGSLPDGTVLEGRLKLDVLSDSMMDRTALNDMDDMQSYESSLSGEEHEPLMYEPVMDMQRFQRLLQEADREERHDHPQFTSSILQDLARKLANRGTHIPASQTQAVDAARKTTTQSHVDEPLTPGGTNFIDSTPTTPFVAAMNDTQKVRRTTARTTADDDGASVDNVATSQTFAKLGDLRTVLDGLECSISDYERQTGRAPAAQRLVQPTFSGYTTALIDAVTRLTSYLNEDNIIKRQEQAAKVARLAHQKAQKRKATEHLMQLVAKCKKSEMRLRVESTLREQLTQDVSQLTTIVDALTSDIIATQEEYAMVKIQFDKFRTTTEQDILMLKQTLSGQGVWMPTPVYPAAQMARPQPVQLQQNMGVQTLNPQPGFMQAPGFVHAGTIGPQARQDGGMSFQTGSNYNQVSQQAVGGSQMAPQAGGVYQRIGQQISNGCTGVMSHDGNVHQQHPQISRNDPPTSLPSQSLPSTAVSQAALLLRDGAQAMSQLGLAYKSASLSVARPVARKLELTDTEPTNAPRPSASETLHASGVHADVRQSQSWPSIAPEGVSGRKETMSRHAPTVTGSLPRPTIPSSAAVLLSAPKQMQSPQVSGYVAGRQMQRSQAGMLSPATWSPNAPGGDNNLAPQPYYSQVLPPGSEVGQGEVEDELRKAEGERRELQRQLEALNLQHAEAQGKLYSMQQGSGLKRQSVSPSISPISHVMTESDQCSVTGDKQRVGSVWEAVSGGNMAAREITVSLPRVEMINPNSPLSPEDVRLNGPSDIAARYKFNPTAVQAM